VSQEVEDRIGAIEAIRRARAAEWRSNSRDEVRSYRLSDADGHGRGEVLRMTRSQSELENKMREDRLQRAEATVEAARQRLAARQQAANEEWERENARRVMLGLSPESAKPIAAAISGIELAEVNYLQTEKRYLWRLCLDGETL
jgi:hypothetical protein